MAEALAAIVGVLAGMLPAQHAADMNPVDALKPAPSPAPRWNTTSCPALTRSATPDGVKLTRCSAIVISLTTPSFIIISPLTI